jgi:hypothetical protein
MVSYVAGFYRTGEPFDDDTIRRTLAALHALSAGFLPASMWLSKDDKATFHAPADYQRHLVPAGYYISPGVARIPLESANGVVLAFTESDTPRTVPANLVMELSDRTIGTNGWDLRTLLSMFRAVIEAFEPNYALVYDEAHRDRGTYDERMFDIDMRRVPLGLFWINYYGPEWVKNVSAERLERLRPMVPAFEWLDNGGVLFAIQQAPYDETVASHRENQQALEELLGLRQLQAQFPNPGL